jgi:hypothetical protein
MSRRSTKARRAARRRRWAVASTLERAARERCRAAGHFYGMGEYLVAARDAMTGRNVDPRLVGAASR